jgi:hypothetical protein
MVASVRRTLVNLHMDPIIDPFPLGAAWKGWESYNQFAGSVKSNLRFVRSKTASSFLDEILASCTGRRVTIPQKKLFWRARLGCESEEVIDGDDGDLRVGHMEDRPYSPSGMKPIPNWQSEGRANPRGIPCLYLATTRDTALAEVRPWIGATISVAQLRIMRDLTLIDCSKHHAKDSLLEIIGDKARPREDGIWIAIDRAFATPVSRDDESKEYIATQIIAELFKSTGYDGIVYKSLLSEDGFNLALFNLNDAEVVNSALFKADSISFDFHDMGSTVFYGR